MRLFGILRHPMQDGVGPRPCRSGRSRAATRRHAFVSAMGMLIFLCACASTGPGGSEPVMPPPSSDSGADTIPGTREPSGRCEPGAYVAGFEAGSNRRLCAACPSGYASTQPNQSTCTVWTECPPGSFASQAGTSKSDRECAPCPEGTASSSSNQSSCTPVGSCPAGSSRHAGGGPHDCETCSAGGYCEGGSAPRAVCPPGTWDHDNLAATPCVEATHCIAGERVAGAPTPLSDRTCAACTSGSFSTGLDATSCIPWTVCSPGSFVSQQGSATSDRVCIPCPAGTLSSSPNQTQCLPAGACPAGFVEREPATGTQPASCEACPPGSYCRGGAASMLACPEGTWDDDTSAATECLPWTACIPGQKVGSSGSALTDRACLSCASGSFSVVSNAPTCAPWTTCEPGSRVSSAGSTISDRACSACEPGTFSNTQNQVACLPLTACPAGTVEIAPATERTPAVCNVCEAGTYCGGGNAPKLACTAGAWDDDGLSATPCTPHTNCATGEYVTSDGSTTSNRTCAACGLGAYSTTSNAAICAGWSSCAAGSYVSTRGTSSSDRGCTACASGTYTSVANESACAPVGSCAAGFEQTATGTSTSPTQCAACPAGTYCAGGNNAKTSCGSGTWDHDQSSTTACAAWTSCLPGQYIATDGTATSDRQCTACPAGTTSTTANASSCTGGGTGSPCTSGSQCASSVCVAGVCQAATCTDGVKNGSESDVDCGGGCTTKCTPGSACAVDLDCGSGICASSQCQANAASCQALLQARPESVSGVYTLDPDGAAGPLASFQAQCDMTVDGGGWTLVLNYLHRGTTNPTLTVRTTSLPLQSSTSLGTDESASSSAWGHADPALMNAISFGAARFFCKTSGHARVMHFKTTASGCLGYFRTGTGSCMPLSNLSAMADHTAIIPTPTTAGSGFQNRGTLAMTDFPFYRGGNNHWGIRGLSGRWECDDFPSNAGRDTFHQIWVR